ncbi:hypothetical protein JQ561_06940 [Bradyrhizobium diazoefficiens]|nr:hypothetical protein [Bradyrhizobium diazoefficiens]
MGQKSAPAAFEQVYVLGLDANGKPRGARFTILRDSIVSAALDLNCRVLIRQPAKVCAVATKLPVGHVFGSGKVVTIFLPNIKRELYVAILQAERLATQQDDLWLAAAIPRNVN